MKVSLPTITVSELQQYAIGYHYDLVFKASRAHVLELVGSKLDALFSDITYRYTEMLKGVFLAWFQEYCGPNKWHKGVRYYEKHCNAITPNGVLGWCEEHYEQLLKIR